MCTKLNGRKLQHSTFKKYTNQNLRSKTRNKIEFKVKDGRQHE